MKILLISPASGKWSRIGRKRVFNGRTFRFSMLSLLTVAKLCPEDARVRIVDEQLEEIPEGEQFDLVGITVMTATAPQAYAISQRFRKRAIPVVLGGFHPSLNTAEALEHADAVVVGCAFGAWERLVEDLKAGKLKSLYYGSAERANISPVRRELVRGEDYVTVNATYATMGCRNKCRFCSISAFYKATLHCRDVEGIVEEVASFKERFFVFVDDNFTQDRDFVCELLRRLRPLKKKWITQASIDVADDDELLRLLKEAGCVGVFIGLETFNEKNLADQSKTVNAPERYREVIRKIHSFGIFVESGVIFGFDSDDRTVFGRTVDMLEAIGIDAIQVSILTPLPGTGLYDDMRGRIVDKDWEHYDYRHVVFEPCRMSAAELQGGTDWVIRRFYSPVRIFKRLLRWLAVPGGLRNFIYPLVLNLGYFGRVKCFEIRGYNPAGGAFRTSLKDIGVFGYRTKRRLSCAS